MIYFQASGTMYFYILCLYNQQLFHKITLHHRNTLKVRNDNILYKAGDLMCELEPVTVFVAVKNSLYMMSTQL